MAGEISNGTIVDVQAGDLIPLYRPGQDPEDYNVLEATDEDWTQWTPSIDTNELSGTPTLAGRYNKIGRQVTIWVFISGTAGSANTFNIMNLPFPCFVSYRELAWVTNNNTAAVGKIEIAASASVMTISPSITAAATGWTTGAVSKGVFFTKTYPTTV